MKLCLFVVVVACLGCAEKSQWDRFPLTGSLTLDGQSADGVLALKPDRGNRGPAVTTSVEAGQFRFGRDNGPVGGTHQASFMRLKTAENSEGTFVSLPIEVPIEAPYEIELEFTQPEPEKPRRRPVAAPPEKSKK